MVGYCGLLVQIRFSLHTLLASTAIDNSLVKVCTYMSLSIISITNDFYVIFYIDIWQTILKTALGEASFPMVTSSRVWQLSLDKISSCPDWSPCLADHGSFESNSMNIHMGRQNIPGLLRFHSLDGDGNPLQTFPFQWWFSVISSLALLVACLSKATCGSVISHHVIIFRQLLAFIAMHWHMRHEHELLMAKFFKRQVLASSSLLHSLLPDRRHNDITTSLRNAKLFYSFRTRTNRFRKSFLPYCLDNYITHSIF